MTRSERRRIAIYGKGGIGKSTVSSNLTAALSDMGVKVLQIGCDPKHDSTRALIGGTVQNTVLDYLKDVRPEDRRLEDVVSCGYKGALCVEAGGPEPGVGCAGRGIISAFDLLERLGSGTIDADITLYDVLGDVVCGGFAVPLRNDYADTVYIVTSGEFMALYAANNILRGTANYNPERIGGIIFNSRGDDSEDERVKRFSEAVEVPIIAKIPRSPLFMDAEKAGRTVVEHFPDSDIAQYFRDLAHAVLEGKRYTAKYLPENELEKLILGRESPKHVRREGYKAPVGKENVKPYSSKTLGFEEAVHGCAFSGASSVCTSIDGLTTILHGPRSCAHFTLQLDAHSVKGSLVRGYEVCENFEDPDVISTDMREDTMVFGGNNLLRSKIEHQISLGKKDFAVITACPPGVIGDDSKAVASSLMREHPGVRIAVLEEDGNATGDFMQGVIDAGVGLMGTYSKKGQGRPYSVNLVGVKAMSSSATTELAQIRAALDGMGIEVNCVVPGFYTMEELESIPDASANLKLNPDVFTDKLCGYMEEHFGTPALEVPVRGGMSLTAEWIRCVGRFFGREGQAEKVIGGMEREFDRLMESPRRLLKGKRCCVITIGNDVTWIKEAVDRAGMELVRAYVLRRSDYNKNLNSELIDPAFRIIEESEVSAAIREINDLKPDIFLSPAMADVDPSIYQSRLPCAPATDPYAGRLLAEDWIRGILAPKEEGWRKDVA